MWTAESVLKLLSDIISKLYHGAEIERAAIK